MRPVFTRISWKFSLDLIYILFEEFAWDLMKINMKMSMRPHKLRYG